MSEDSGAVLVEEKKTADWTMEDYMFAEEEAFKPPIPGDIVDGAVVRVGFQINTNATIGDETRADIKIKTLLGQKYIALSPAGVGKLRGDIPLARTTTPLDVTQAFIGLGQRAGLHHLAAIFTSYPANGHQRLGGGLPGPAHALQPNHRSMMLLERTALPHYPASPLALHSGPMNVGGCRGRRHAGCLPRCVETGCYAPRCSSCWGFLYAWPVTSAMTCLIWV